MNVTEELVRWYEQYKRDLPWRATADPYKIWVAEVILQQTRVDQGLAYYHRFIERFPDTISLASAPEDEVLKMWQGLGYYSRARNLRVAARTIVNDFDGEFPRDYEDIRKLKGVGDYTAAAIASFAFNEPYPVIDGNVNRFISRLYGIEEPVDKRSTRNMILEILGELIDRKDPSTFNQALMEFGALQCVPANPDCNSCVFHEQCLALRHGKVAKIPVKSSRQKIRKVKYDYYMLLWRDNGGWMTLLRKRDEPGIWKGLYDFPLVETDAAVTGNKDDREATPWFVNAPGPVETTGGYRHLLSHREITAFFHIVKLERAPSGGQRKGYLTVRIKDLGNYPVSRLVDNFLQDQVSGILDR